MKLEIRTETIKNAGCVSELSRKWLLRMFENEIAEVFQKGYKIGDKVVRHATVKVAN